MNAPIVPQRIEYWPLARLKPCARNAKTHDPDQVATSIAEFGWPVPVLVAADGELIDGHGRVLAAAYLGLIEVTVIGLGHRPIVRVSLRRHPQHDAVEVANDICGAMIGGFAAEQGDEWLEGPQGRRPRSRPR